MRVGLVRPDNLQLLADCRALGLADRRRALAMAPSEEAEQLAGQPDQPLAT